MSETFIFSFPRPEAERILKEELAQAKAVVDNVREVNGGLGRKYSGIHDNLPFFFVLYFNKKNFSTRIVVEKAGASFFSLIGDIMGSPFISGHKDRGDDNSALLKNLRGRPRIGTDESGKGDFFGPLVICGVYVDADLEKKLDSAGVRDSKLFSDKNIFSLAGQIRRILNKKDYEIISISPEKYNQLYAKIGNLNKLLAWGHARVLENILMNHACECAIADRFGDEKRIKQALMRKGAQICLHQIHRAERDTAVAAASVLARDTFVKQLDLLSRKFKMELPKGASSRVESAGRKFIKTQGEKELKKAAKLHFKTAQRIIT